MGLGRWSLGRLSGCQSSQRCNRGCSPLGWLIWPKPSRRRSFGSRGWLETPHLSFDLSSMSRLGIGAEGQGTGSRASHLPATHQSSWKGRFGRCSMWRSGIRNFQLCPRSRFRWSGYLSSCRPCTFAGPDRRLQWMWTSPSGFLVAFKMASCCLWFAVSPACRGWRCPILPSLPHSSPDQEIIRSHSFSAF